jgi:iron-sulfur cluster assembly accessory protein
MIQLTEKAARQILSIVDDANSQGLRIFIDKGGCSGMQYNMKIDEAADTDTVIENQGGRVFIDPDSLRYLQGVTIDFTDSLTDTGFKIRNPNAKQTCGCGTSFEPGEPA